MNIALPTILSADGSFISDGNNSFAVDRKLLKSHDVTRDGGKLAPAAKPSSQFFNFAGANVLD